MWKVSNLTAAGRVVATPWRPDVVQRVHLEASNRSANLV